MFRSVTFRLTMWYLAIVMVISLAFSAVIYRFATNELSYGLHRQTQRIFRQYPVFSNNPLVDAQEDDVSQGAHHILLRLAYFNVLVLIGAGFASYWLARRTLEPIEVAHEQQKRFTADVSHELRTPLTSLKMGAEVALMDKQAGKQELRAALESNLEEAAKMDTLINNLLRLTRLDGNEAHANFTNFTAEELAATAAAQVHKIAASKHITIDNTVTAGSLHGDFDALTQLLVILLDNAIKYSPEHSTITLSSKQHDHAVRLAVSDSGQGITPQELPHVFDRFYRADSARTKDDTSDGFGLGLSIAKLIADRHAGSITLTSKPGKGTTATVVLPIVHDQM